jgi:hypothetical protein
VCFTNEARNINTQLSLCYYMWGPLVSTLLPIVSADWWPLSAAMCRQPGAQAPANRRLSLNAVFRLPIWDVTPCSRVEFRKNLLTPSSGSKIWHASSKVSHLLAYLPLWNVRNVGVTFQGKIGLVFVMIATRISTPETRASSSTSLRYWIWIWCLLAYFPCNEIYISASSKYIPELRSLHEIWYTYCATRGHQPIQFSYC